MSTTAKLAKTVTGNSSLVRPRFSPGLLLRDDDLRQGVDYTRDLSRLLFRSLFGCGVVCGLRVSWVFKCGKLLVTVAPGVALDCCGDPIHVPEPQTIPVDPHCDEKLPSKLWVVIRRIEKCCAPRMAACSCDDDETPAVCTRERDCYEIKLLSCLPDCVCGCDALPPVEPPEEPPAAEPPPELILSRRTTRRAQAATASSAQAASGGAPPEPKPVDCWCVNPEDLPCYADHYAGLCGCDCCDCEWVVLALLTDNSTPEAPAWKLDHSVRRFVRPVLMRDPVVWEVRHPKNAAMTV